MSVNTFQEASSVQGVNTSVIQTFFSYTQLVFIVSYPLHPTEKMISKCSEWLQ